MTCQLRRLSDGFVKAFLQIRKDLAAVCRTNPSLTILAAMVAGIIPFALNTEIRISSAFLCTLSLCAMLAAILNLKNTIKFAVFAGAASVLAMNARMPSPENYDSMLPSKNCGATVEAAAVDTSCSPEESADWLPQPYLMRTEILRFKYSETDIWHDTEGFAAVILPKDCPRIGYGDRILMKGAFILPPPPLFKGDFDFRNYLLANGMGRVFEAERCEILGQCGKYRLYRAVMSVRNFLMNRMVSGMRDVENKRIAAAVVFGCRQGLSAEDRRNFLRSGTIHVFSISGLHVGVMAVMLFWMFRWLPFRTRHIIVPGLIFVYVFTTGNSPPAVRALLMIGVWCVQRAFLYPSSSLNSVFFAAAMILLFNPFSILDVGFQFSFIVAGFLVLSWNNSERLVSSALEPARWAPAGHGFSPGIVKNRLAVNALRSLITSVVAWLSGVGLCLSYQGLFSSSAILTNFAIIPFVSLFFGAVIVKTVLFPLGALANIANIVCERSLDAIRNASGWGAAFGNEHLLRPSLWLLVVFYIAVILLIATERRKVFVAAALSVVLILGTWYWQGTFSKGGVYMVCGGESQEPVIAVCPPGGGCALIVNTGSAQTVKSLLNLLYGRGVDSVDTLLICEPRKDFSAGAGRILSGLRVSQLVLPEKFRQSWSSKRAVESAENEGCTVAFIGGEGDKAFRRGNLSCRFVKRGDGMWDYLIEYTLRERPVSLRIARHGPGKSTVKVSSAGNGGVFDYVNTNIPVLKKMSLE